MLCGLNGRFASRGQIPYVKCALLSAGVEKHAAWLLAIALCFWTAYTSVFAWDDTSYAALGKCFKCFKSSHYMLKLAHCNGRGERR